MQLVRFPEHFISLLTTLSLRFLLCFSEDYQDFFFVLPFPFQFLCFSSPASMIIKIHVIFFFFLLLTCVSQRRPLQSSHHKRRLKCKLQATRTPEEKEEIWRVPDCESWVLSSILFHMTRHTVASNQPVMNMKKVIISEEDLSEKGHSKLYDIIRFTTSISALFCF